MCRAGMSEKASWRKEPGAVSRREWELAESGRCWGRTRMNHGAGSCVEIPLMSRTGQERRRERAMGPDTEGLNRAPALGAGSHVWPWSP